MSLAHSAPPRPFRIDTERFARCIATSKRVRWDIDDDVLRGRRFDAAHRFLPDGLTRVHELGFLTEAERRYLGQVQGRTYANMFGLVERFIGAKVVEISQDHALGDQVALEALLRFGEEELKHQELFRRIERMIGETFPEGYSFAWDPNAVADAVLASGSWAVMALTLHIELFSQAHYRQSVEPDATLSPLFKDVLLYHWREESQHAILDELEWRRIDAAVTPAERDDAVDQFIALVAAVDNICRVQAASDASYFAATCGRELSPEEQAATEVTVLAAYRWQYIQSGAGHPHFLAVLDDLATARQQTRIFDALAAIA